MAGVGGGWRSDSKRHLAGPAGRPQLAAVQIAPSRAQGRKPVARTLPEIVAKRFRAADGLSDKAYAALQPSSTSSRAAKKAKAPGRRGLAEAFAMSPSTLSHTDYYESAPLQRRRVS